MGHSLRIGAPVTSSNGALRTGRAPPDVQDGTFLMTRPHCRDDRLKRAVALVRKDRIGRLSAALVGGNGMEQGITDSLGRMWRDWNWERKGMEGIECD